MTNIGTIFVDRSIRIKFYTPSIRSIFTVIPSDRGRLLSDISTNLVGVDLQADIARVLDRLERVEREVTTRDGRWLLMHAMPYRTMEDRIDGVVLTFLDITDRTMTAERLQESQARLRLVIESVTDYAIFTTDLHGRIDTWNTGARNVFGYSAEEAIGSSVEMLFTREDRQQGAPAEEMRQAREYGRAADERWHVRKDGTRFFASGILTALRDPKGTLLGFVKIARDLTERKRSDDTLQRDHDSLEQRVADRTGDLEAANRALDTELRERRQSEERVRRLLTRLISVQEEERRRIARDLHDHLGQQVTALRLKLESGMPSIPGGSETTERLREAHGLITMLDKELDFLTWELRPAALDDLGLVATLGTYVREWSKNYQIAGEFHSTSVGHERFGFEFETNLYRIAQEALNNIYKHAQAQRVGVILERRQDEVVLIVEDDGRGFVDVDSGHRTTGRPDTGFGLVGMQERAALLGGRLEIETAPGQGTTVIVQLPIRHALESEG